MADKDTPTPPAGFSCLWGTPFQDATGAWHCPSDYSNPAPPSTPPVTPTPTTPRGGGRGGSTINIILPSTVPNDYPQVNLPTTPAGTQPATIFGMSPLVAIGIGAAALWALSTFGGGDTAQKGRH